MRPTLKIADEHMLDKIIGEAKRILATTGMEIRGAALRQRLVDHGFPMTASGRIIFPVDKVDAAVGVCPCVVCAL